MKRNIFFSFYQLVLYDLNKIIESTKTNTSASSCVMFANSLAFLCETLNIYFTFRRKLKYFAIEQFIHTSPHVLLETVGIVDSKVPIIVLRTTKLTHVIQTYIICSTIMGNDKHACSIHG